MYVTKVKAIIALVLVLLIATQGSAFADSITGKLLTPEQIEKVHEGDNVARITIAVEEKDGDTWLYIADSTTHDKYRAIN